MRLLGPIACRKVCRNTAEIQENDQSVVLNRRLPVSTFSSNHWSCRCHLLAPHWAEIDRLASGAERAREIKEKKHRYLAIADRLVLPLQLPSRKFAKSLRSRKADRGTQETWGRNGVSTCLLECENASSKVALSHTLFWKTWKETTISWGIHFWIVCRPVGSSLESVGHWVKGENPLPKVCCERGKRQEEREMCW